MADGRVTENVRIIWQKKKKKTVNTISEEYNNILVIKSIKLLTTDQVREIILNIAANIYVFHTVQTLTH